MIHIHIHDFDPHRAVILAVLATMGRARTNVLGAVQAIRAAMGEVAGARNYNATLGKWLARCDAVRMLDPDADKPDQGHLWAPA